MALMCSVVLLAARVDFRLQGGVVNGATTILAQDDDYVLSVVCDGSAQEVSVNGVEESGDFVLQQAGTSQSMTMINGKTSRSITYNYHMQPLSTGSFVLGPVVVKMGNGTIEESNKINITVVDSATYDARRGKHSASDSLSCRLEISSPTAVAGEQVLVTVVMEDDGKVQSRSLQPPSFGKLRCTPDGEPTAEQKLVNGNLRVVSKQKYLMSADEPGVYTIGPAIGHFVVPDEEHDPFGSFFGMRMGSLLGGGKKRSVRSQSIQLSVIELPETDEPFDGVGTFSAYKLQSDKRIVELNEPFTLTLTLVGSGNFDAITTPQLQLLDSMMVYPSHATVGVEGNEKLKRFEYTMQMSEAGTQTIPAQIFHYYDTSQKAYLRIQSMPLTIQVKGAKLVSRTEAPQQTEEEDDEYEDESFAQYEESALSWWLLLLCMAIAMLFFMRDALRRMIAQLMEKLGITSATKREAARLKHLNVEELHTFFQSVLVRVWGCSTEQIDEHFLEEKTADHGFDENHQRQFVQFMMLCSQAAFASDLVSEKDKAALLAKASYWHLLLTQERK